MSMAIDGSSAVAAGETEFATFCVGDLFLGIGIGAIQEIGRYVEPTVVPHAPECVRGVVNLRGDVVTVIDLRTVLELGRCEATKQTRNIIVNAGGERIGLMADRVADVVKVNPDDLEPPPANVGGADGRYFAGVHKLEKELLVILDLNEVLASAG